MASTKTPGSTKVAKSNRPSRLNLFDRPTHSILGLMNVSEVMFDVTSEHYRIPHTEYEHYVLLKGRFTFEGGMDTGELIIRNSGLNVLTKKIRFRIAAVNKNEVKNIGISNLQLFKLHQFNSMSK